MREKESEKPYVQQSNAYCENTTVIIISIIIIIEESNLVTENFKL
jgi:hypothetical protein